jgi:hypothetical protein
MGEGQEAARTLQRRMRARTLYRKRRDRKIAVDLLGKHFEYRHTRQLDGAVEWIPMQLVGYDPDRAVVLLRALWPEAEGASFPWATDTFWSQYKTGNLRDA